MSLTIAHFSALKTTWVILEPNSPEMHMYLPVFCGPRGNSLQSVDVNKSDGQQNPLGSAGLCNTVLAVGVCVFVHECYDV